MKATLLQGVAVGSAIGVVLGVGAFTFVYAKGGSYLTDNPAACANCHIMQEHYDAWHKGSHRSVASCNDCHTPHALIPKYYVKAENGFWHSFYFTTGTFDDPIRAREVSLRVTENNCRRCHSQIVDQIDRHPAHGNQLDCIRCHREVGHPLR